jgi:hypothetical protein
MKIKFIDLKNGEGFLAHHIECAGNAEGYTVGTSFTQWWRFEPVFCYKCQGELGFYNPELDLDIAVRLQAIVNGVVTRFRRTKSPAWFEHATATTVALGLMGDSFIIDVVKKDGIGLRDVALCVENYANFQEN